MIQLNASENTNPQQKSKKKKKKNLNRESTVITALKDDKYRCMAQGMALFPSKK